MGLSGMGRGSKNGGVRDGEREKEVEKKRDRGKREEEEAGRENEQCRQVG